MSLWWFGWSGTVFLSSTRVIFAAAFDRMLPEGVSYVEPRTRTPIVALMLMVIPGIIIAILYAFDVMGFQTLVLDATLVIAVTFFGTTIAATILPWRSKDVYEGSPIAKYKMPGWLGWIVMLLFVVGGIYLIYTSFSYMYTVLTNLGATAPPAVTWLSVIVVSLLTVFNAGLIIWLAYYVGKRILAGAKMPLVTLAGLVFFLFLNWLLIEWFWTPCHPIRLLCHRLVERYLNGVHAILLCPGSSHLLRLQRLSQTPGYRRQQSVLVDPGRIDSSN
jgi:hypothetical protein